METLISVKTHTIRFYKIINKEHCHYGFHYKDGLNVLTEKFNDDPSKSCCSGGFYFTTLKYLHRYLYLGCFIREVILPDTDTDFKIVEDSKGDKWRANKIILGTKYDLSDINIYDIFELENNKYFIKKWFEWAYCCNHLHIIKFLLETHPNTINYKLPFALYHACEFNYKEIVKLLIEFDKNLIDQTSLEYAVKEDNIEIEELLLNTQKDINDNFIYSAFNLACKTNKIESVKFLVKYIQNPKNFEQSLQTASKKGFYDIVECLVENKIKVTRRILEETCIKNQVHILPLFKRNGVDLCSFTEDAVAISIYYGHIDILSYFIKIDNDKNKIANIIKNYLDKYKRYPPSIMNFLSKNSVY